MPRHFDLILAGATVVNQDGVARATSASRDGKIAEIGDLYARRGGRADRLPRAARPARRDRQPGAFPRAGPDPQGGPRDRLARRGARRRDGGVRDAQHRPADDLGRGARRQGRARDRPHALRLRLLGRRHARQCRRHPRTRAPAGRGGDQGVHGLVDRHAAGRRRRRRAGDPQADAPPRRLPQRGRGAARSSARTCASPAIPPRIPSGATRSRRCAAPSG